jgi:hypothetical protein
MISILYCTRVIVLLVSGLDKYITINKVETFIKSSNLPSMVEKYKKGSQEMNGKI